MDGMLTSNNRTKTVSIWTSIDQNGKWDMRIFNCASATRCSKKALAVKIENHLKQAIIDTHIYNFMHTWWMIGSWWKRHYEKEKWIQIFEVVGGAGRYSLMLMRQRNTSSNVFHVALRTEYFDELIFVIVNVTLHDLHTRTEQTFKRFHV